MSRRMNRRGFLHAAASGLAGWWILERSRSAWSYQASERLSIALVGAGRRGLWFADAVPRAGENLRAVCDVDRERAEGASRKTGGEKRGTVRVEAEPSERSPESFPRWPVARALRLRPAAGGAVTARSLAAPGLSARAARLADLPGRRERRLSP